MDVDRCVVLTWIIVNIQQIKGYDDPSTTPTTWGDFCFNHTIINSNLTRSVGYIFRHGDMIDCESSTLTEGWYRFEGFQNIPTVPVWPGQCGTMYPIWLNGSYPAIPLEAKIMTACIPGNTTACDRSWPVAVLHCSGYNIVYLKPSESCGRYCMESDYVSWPTLPPWISPCVNHTVIKSNLTRTTQYYKQNGDTETCESSNLGEGWYRYENFENMPTEAPEVGQCGTMSPIWFKGRYPASFENNTMSACVVNLTSDCSQSWNVTVMNCYLFNVVYLKPVPSCARYCMNSSNHFISPSITLSDLIGKTSGVRSPYNTDLPMSYTDLYRHDYSSNLVSSSQVYFTNGYLHSTMEASSHGGSSQNYIQTDIPSAMNTFPPFSSYIMTSTSINTPVQDNYQSLRPSSTLNSYFRETSISSVPILSTDTSNHYFAQSVTPSYSSSATDVCNNHRIIQSNLSRSVGYIYQYGDTIDCESSTLVEGWYRFEGYQNIPTVPTWPGQCGTIYPVWLNGSYPSSPGETKIMKACIPGNTTACNRSWNVTVMHCSGYNIAYLRPVESCGRYCMESDYVSWPTLPPWISPCVNHTVIKSNLTRTTQYYKQNGDTETCESSNLGEGWYRYENFENIPTEAPQVGQCGSASPIWLKGRYPAPFENNTMTACVVNSISDCAEIWNVTVMNCYAFNVLYLRPVPACGRYCMNNSNQFISPSTAFSYLIETTSSSRNTDLQKSYTSLAILLSSEGYFNSVNQQSTMDFSPRASYSQGYLQTSNPSVMTTFVLGNTGSFYTPVQDHSKNSMPSASFVYLTADSQSKISKAPTDSYVYSASQSVVQYSAYFHVSAISQNLTLNSSVNSYIVENSQYKLPLFSTPASTSEWNMSFLQSRKATDIGINLSTQIIGSSYEDKSISIQSTSTSEISRSSMTPSSFTYIDRMSSTQPNSSQTSLYQSSSSSNVASNSTQTTYSTNQNIFSSLSTSFTSSTAGNVLDLSTYISYIYAYPVIPTYQPTSADRQLMFQCSYYTGYGYGYDTTVLNGYEFDVLWEINDKEFLVKSNLTLSQISTLGRLKGTELSDRGITMGFNVKCGIRFSVHQHLGNNSYVKSSWSYYVGLDIWPKSLSISSGQSASVYVWSTVPIACKYDSNYPCKLVIEMVDFTEQFTSGAPKYCNESITELTKPSLCGLELDGWRTPWTWQTLNVNLPENTAQDQEYTAKLHLKVSSAVDDPMWLNYHLPEIHINVVNDNVTDDYWWWYGWCFTGTDPWFFTFDWHWYDFHDEGEFVLYRHKTKPIEVHTIQRRYEPEHTWTEHCAIAIRAASDVFIIYGCGRPTKWIVRREGCDTGNEYLEVYSRWGGYEITLPTGSRVYVWISVNRRLNAYITLSRTDRYETEGLCGTWNRNYDDDYTGRDGHIYNDATEFARTWSVPSSDSLFIAKKRTEKLSQSFMYCTCLGKTLDKLSPNVDCSWKESLPVCPPLNWEKESCTIRTKRSTDSEEDLTIDVSPDIVAYTRRPTVGSGWKNGWNQSSAEDACNIYFNQSVLFAACSSLSNVNGSSAIANCILNIQVAGTNEYMADSFEMFKTQCSNEVRTNNTLWTETNANGTFVAEMITQNDCPYDCKYKGVKKGDCIQGSCNCYAGYTGDDCRVDLNSPPSIATDLSNDSFCDASTKACIYASIFGENFYNSQNLRCLIDRAEIVNNTLVRNGTSVTTNGRLVNLGEVKCPLIAGARRRRRSVTTSTSTDYYLVSVTNNGVNYSDPLPVIHFDSSCTTCTTSSTYVFCQLRSDVCVINGMCYAQSSSHCSASTSSSDSKLWIIGVIGCVLLFVIILILLIKCCKKSRPVSPFCGSDDGHVYDKPGISGHYEILSRAGTPNSATRINVRSVEK